MWITRLILGLLILVVLALAGFLIWSSRPEIVAINPPEEPQFDPAQIAKGAELAAIGNCALCHTMPGGAPYAGGRAIPTPFGTVYSSNITPDPATGIGRWSEAAFRRALRDGVARRGTYLYPAFPYDHYTRLSDGDIAALYAFQMTRVPVERRTPRAALPFPLSIRRLVAFWDLLYLDRSPFRADPKESAAWNRGAYLAAGLGHCGDCHTPRNFLGAEETAKALSGGEAEGWQGFALNAASPAPVPWNAEQLFAYLSHGEDAAHGAAAGPMRPVTQDLAQATAQDVRAIAIYVASLRGPVSDAKRQRADALAARARRPASETAAASGDLGALLFAGACARCHQGGPSLVPPRGIDLALSSVVSAPDPGNAIFIILDGIHPEEGQRGPSMPGFSGSFTDQQMAALLRYLRARYSDRGPWQTLDSRIHDIRQSRERS
ncbi:MAG TPA: cytochrome c [Stellaceae bacterium]|nr:cytochrome c [Stellaceae bacterium]